MTPQIVEEKLAKLLQKLSLHNPITVGDIKEIIWNTQKNSGSSELFFLLTKQEKDQTIIDETLHLMQDAWNYFPHRILGGKSPNDFVEEYKQTGKIDQTTQSLLPKQGKSLQEVFESQHPKTVTFENLGENTWGWSFPKIYHDFTEQLWELEETSVPTQIFEKELCRMIKLLPELFEAVNDLTHIYIKKKEPGIAKMLYVQAITNARRYIPKSFIPGRDQIIWAYMANRPFLRIMAGYAMFIERYEGIENAIPLYEEILSFNPNDNQGIRAILATAYLKTNHPEKVIELASHYRNDILPDLIMGKLLAYLKLGKNNIAQTFLEQVKDHQSHVIKELLKQSHPKPANIIKDRIRIGGEDEAYYYWQSQGNLWQTTHDALVFLTEHTKYIQEQIIFLKDEEVLAVDFFHDFLAFLNLLKERPIKRTTTGNISIKDVSVLLKTLKTVLPILQHTKDMGWQLRKEDEILQLHLIRIIADIMQLTYKKHDKLYISKNGMAFLDKLSPSDQFSQLFQHYQRKLNWAYFTSFTKKQETLAESLQTLQDHIWRILIKKGTKWSDYKTFCKTLLDELPLQQLLEESYSTPEEILFRRINTILFSRILKFFGCVEFETKQINRWEAAIIRFRMTKIGLAMFQEFL